MVGDLFRRHKLAIVLAVLLALVALKYRHSVHSVAALRANQRPHGMPAPPGPPGALGSADPFPAPDPAMRQRMEAALQKMPAEQRKAVEERMKADRAFFESLKDLPEDQRRKKMQEHFAENPPPPGFGPGGPGPGGHGGDPGNGDPIQLPPPDVRRSMDQQIANSLKQMNGS